MLPLLSELVLLLAGNHSKHVDIKNRFCHGHNAKSQALDDAEIRECRQGLLEQAEEYVQRRCECTGGIQVTTKD